MHLGVHITIDDPEQLEAIRKRFVLYRSILVDPLTDRFHG